MFSNRKNNGSGNAESSRPEVKARNSKTSKSSQQYKSVLNSSMHGVFSIEDEEDEEDEDVGGKLSAVLFRMTLWTLVPMSTKSAIILSTEPVFWIEHLFAPQKESSPCKFHKFLLLNSF